MKYTFTLPAGPRVVFDAANEFHAAGIVCDLVGRWPRVDEIRPYDGPSMFDVTMDEVKSNFNPKP